MDSSMMRPDSDAKFEHFKELAETRDTSYGLWIPLSKKRSGLQWLTKDGYEPVTAIASGLEEPSPWYPQNGHRYNENGLLYRNSYVYRADHIANYPYFVCEKRANCSEGWFGLGCDKECHCYGEECDPQALEVSCRYGCELGWMGKDCTQRKQDAAVRHFCVNSPDQGKYAHLRIDTKGVDYENIHAVDEKGRRMSWCNGTTIHKDNQLSILTIKIHVDDITTEQINNKTCAGKIATNGHYEWQFRIQEKGGIVSRNDQDFHIECDFDGGDSFRALGEGEIKREGGFKQSDIKRPIEYLNEKKETVKLQLADPVDGSTVSANKLGSTVMLKISFGVGEEDVATGIVPYDCFASTSDLKKNVTLLDGNGCETGGNLVSDFYKKDDSKTLVTKPFNLFGFEGSEDVDFHCSYILCFENDPCPVGCHKGAEWKHAGNSRQRRSATATVSKMNSETHPMKGMVKTPLGQALKGMVKSPLVRRQTMLGEENQK